MKLYSGKFPIPLSLHIIVMFCLSCHNCFFVIIQMYTFRSKFPQAQFFFLNWILKPSGHSVSHLKNINDNDLCTYNLVHLGNFCGKYAFTIKLSFTKGREMKTSIYLFGLALCVKLNTAYIFWLFGQIRQWIAFLYVAPPPPGSPLWCLDLWLLNLYWFQRKLMQNGRLWMTYLNFEF